MAVVGCALLNSRSLGQAVPILGPSAEMFFEATLGELYTAAVGLYQAGKPVDPVTMAGKLGANFDPGLYADCQAKTPTSANAQHYAGIVRDAWAARELINAAKTLYHGTFEGWQDWRGLLAQHLSRVDGVARRDSKAGVHSLEGAFDALIQTFEAMARGGHNTGQIPLGFQTIDAALVGGLMPGELCVIAARPALGKSATALNVCEGAIGQGVSTLFVSLEMSVSALTERMAGIMGAADTRRIRCGFCADAEMDKLRRIDRKPMQYLTIADPATSRISDIQAIIKGHHEKRGPGLIIIDYLQLITTFDREKRSRNEVVGAVTRALKQLAGQIASPIVILAQLNREAEKESDPYRLLAHLRESGAIEQDADSILFLTQLKAEDREKISTRFSIPKDNLILFTLAKNRRGPQAHCYLNFERELQRIREPGARYTQPAPAIKPSAYFGGVTGEKYEEDEDEFAF